MRELDKTKNQTKQSVRTRRESKSVQENCWKPSNTNESLPKSSPAKPALNSVASAGAEPSDVYENVVLNYEDDLYRSRDAVQVSKVQEPTVGDKNDDLEDFSSEFSNDIQQASGSDSDYESVKDTTSSQDSDENLDVAFNFPEKSSSDVSEVRFTRETSNSGVKPSHSSQNPIKSNGSTLIAEDFSSDNNSKDMKVHPSSSASSEETNDKPVEETNQVMFDKPVEERAAMKQKVDIMESRLKKLENELRVVAALEISLYSVIPEHGSSAHKVHTPARRLSRLYIHSCKHSTKSMRATIARNIVSGLIMVSKTCGNDASRLTFWLSNTVVLREIISQAYCFSGQSSPSKLNRPNGSGNGSEENSFSMKLDGISSRKQVSMITQRSRTFEDWEETSTFTSALSKVESWIFSQVVESVWWQVITPNMQPPVEELYQKNIGKLLGPSLGDHQQGTLSIELWKNAFQGAFERLCPVRAAGLECGCLPVLTRMVMEQCIGRLDVAMFNAILRESAHQIPTDPVSDPISDSRILPIPAGELSFGSGAQLKNSVGYWSRWFSDHLGSDTDPLMEDNTQTSYDEHKTLAKTKCFCLLDELSDLLMLPKEMLMDRSIREEVCPSINLGVIKRVLCYFTPDEFCPDPVHGEVLEALNAENYLERKLAGESSVSFPYSAPAVSYSIPSSHEVAEKVGEIEGSSLKFERNVSMVHKKGYMSDEELDYLDSSLESFIKQSSPRVLQNGNVGLKSMQQIECKGNARFELLREVWSL